MMQPKKQKYRKQFRGTMTGLAQRGSGVDFGEYGLKAISAGWVSARQIEAARKAVAKYIQKGGKIWIRIFPDKPVTKKALGTRMGSGKGDVDQYVAVVRPGRIIFEVAGIGREKAEEAFARAKVKLPVACAVTDKEMANG